MIGRPRAVVEDGEDLDAVGRADRPADAALRVDAGGNEGVDLGRTRTGGGAQRSNVSWRMPSVSILKPDRAASCRQDSGAGGIGQGGVEADDLDFPQLAEKPRADQLAHHVVAFESEWAGHDLRHEMGIARGGQHLRGPRRRSCSGGPRSGRACRLRGRPG